MAELRHDYSEAIPMFRVLATLSRDSIEFKRQRDEIVGYCLPLADNIARRYKDRGEPLEDLVQVARVGLVKAVTRYDVETGSEFLAFAIPTIMGEIRRHFRDHGWAIKVPRGLKNLSLRINAGRAELSYTLSRAPTATELAKHLGVEFEQVVEGIVASCAYATYSIDVPVGADDDRRALHETMGGLDANFDRVLDIETVRPLIAALPERDRNVLMLRFFENMTQSQIAQRIGVSQMHVSRILAGALGSLREQAQAGESARAPICAVDRASGVSRIGSLPRPVQERSENVA